MGNKISSLKDAKFVIYDQLKVEKLCESERFQEHSRETFEMVINEAERIAVNDLAPVNSEGDKVGCIWQDGKIKIPESFHRPYKKVCEGGWIGATEDYDAGGQQLPTLVYHVCSEMFYAANLSLFGYAGLTHSAAKCLEIYGTDEQKKKYMLPLYTGRYSGTMDLTEPQAGSDVGAIRTKALRNRDGTYSISGQKLFITAGEHNLTENIIHIVLARIEGSPEGTRGLSCFVVPKIRVNDDGSLGENNNIYCTNIEHKMGMRASATCGLNFGENGECIGELLGEEQKGIMVMFHMMNEQRVEVGCEGLGLANSAYLHALDFARERLQGPPFGAKSNIQVPIISHPDVRKNLLWMKCYTEGLRALLLYIVYCMDKVSVSKDEDERRNWQDMVEVLTPIGKAYATDRSFEVCVKAIQVLGGYGFCEDYLVEQYARDCKITSIFEGTTGIQAIDLFGRKINLRKGEAFQTIITKIEQTIKETSGVSELSQYTEEVGKHLAGLKEITNILREQSSSKNAYQAYSWATPYLEIFGDVVLGWMFLWQARVAYDKLQGIFKDQGAQDRISRDKLIADNPDAAFLTSKIVTAKYYIGSFLPLVEGKITSIKKNDRSFLEMEEALFID